MSSHFNFEFGWNRVECSVGESFAEDFMSKLSWWLLKSCNFQFGLLCNLISVGNNWEPTAKKAKKTLKLCGLPSTQSSSSGGLHRLEVVDLVMNPSTRQFTPQLKMLNTHFHRHIFPRNSLRNLNLKYYFRLLEKVICNSMELPNIAIKSSRSSKQQASRAWHFFPRDNTFLIAVTVKCSHNFSRASTWLNFKEKFPLFAVPLAVFPFFRKVLKRKHSMHNFRWIFLCSD